MKRVGFAFFLPNHSIAHGYDPWEPMGGTMGFQGGYHGCPMGRIPKPPGPQGTLGPLGPQGLIGPQGLMAPQGTQGSGFK